MNERHRDFLQIQQPNPQQEELLRMYRARQKQEREFPGVDIDAIHRKQLPRKAPA